LFFKVLGYYVNVFFAEIDEVMAVKIATLLELLPGQHIKQAESLLHRNFQA
jgi:hypothetical protein